jgi:hypothetical protein
MPIAACPSCQTKLRIADGAGGAAYQCPRCSRVFRIGSGAPTISNRLPPGPAPAIPPPWSKFQDDPVLDESDVEVVDDALAPSAPGGIGGEDELEVVDEPGDEIAVERVVRKGDPFQGQDVSDKVQERIRNELAKGEKIVWVGRPSLRVLPMRIGKPLPIGIGSVVGAFILIGNLPGMLLSKSLPGWYILLACALMGCSSVFFLAIGGLICVLCLSSYLIRLFPSLRMIYVLTDRRALVFERVKWSVRRYQPFHLAGMICKKSAMVRGAGDLIFESEKTTRYENGPRGAAKIEKTPYGFLHLENVGEIEQLIEATLLEGPVGRVRS